MNKDYYVMLIIGDIEPELFGPFQISDDRDSRAAELMREYSDTSGYFRLDISGNKPEVDSFSGTFYDRALRGKV